MRPALDLAGDARLVVTTRDDGDQRPRAAAGRLPAGPPAVVARQVHGAGVVVCDDPGDPGDADALVTARPGLALAVLGADCSLIGLIGTGGVIAVVHAGWRGLLAGVVEQAVAAVRALGASTVGAFVGPTIGPECYAFSPGDLAPLVARFGRAVSARTRSGDAALDLPAAVAAALDRAGVERRVTLGTCTACDGRFYSFRARREPERHALVCWREEAC